MAKINLNKASCKEMLKHILALENEKLYAEAALFHNMKGAKHQLGGKISFSEIKMMYKYRFDIRAIAKASKKSVGAVVRTLDNAIDQVDNYYKLYPHGKN